MRMVILIPLITACTLNVEGLSKPSWRIVGGDDAHISQYPYVASLLYSWNSVTFMQMCGGTIITTTAILSAAQCFVGHEVARWRARLGSNLANSSGNVYVLRSITLHPQFEARTLDNDIAVLRTDVLISYVTERIAPATISGPGYNVADNQPLWALGWGSTSFGGPTSQNLQHVNLRLVNHSVCRLRYAELGEEVTDNMICAGLLDEGNRGMCSQDAGGPLVHNRVVVGVLSWNKFCGLARYPTVSTRISNYVAWIQSTSTG